MRSISYILRPFRSTVVGIRFMFWIACFIIGINQLTFGSIFLGLSSMSSTAVDCAEIPPTGLHTAVVDFTTLDLKKNVPIRTRRRLGLREKNEDSTDDQVYHKTEFVAQCQMPSTFGTFLVRSYIYTSANRRMEPVVVISGDVRDKENVLVRVHDQCFTSEVLGSLRCDCREQLHSFLSTIDGSEEGGILIYLQQEGRGIGLSNKIAAYSLQDLGFDTVDANLHLGFKDEMREYNVIPDILKDLGVKSIRLATNNPYKIGAMTNLGVRISERVPLQIQSNVHNNRYLDSKRDRMGHFISQHPDRSDVRASVPSTADIMSNMNNEQSVRHEPIVASRLSPAEPRGGSSSGVEGSSPSVSIASYAFGKESVEAAISAICRGEVVVVVDDENRENEGDLIMSAAKATADTIGFIVRYSSGVICVSLEGDRLDELKLPPMVVNNEDPKQTAYSVSTDFKLNTTTGISSADRALTFRALADRNHGPEMFQRPGHVFPLRYKEGGVLARAGHTEASLDLSRLAGLPPAGVLAEIVHDDGSLMRLPSLREFSRTHGLVLTSVQDLIAYRQELERTDQC